MSYTDDSVRSSPPVNQSPQGGWHEAPGSERPFSPRFDTESAHDSEPVSSRPRWAWALALACVFGLLWIALGAGSLSGFFGSTAPAAPPEPELRPGVAPAMAVPDSPKPRVRRPTTVAPGSVDTPASPWLDDLTGLVLVPPQEPLEQIAESLSPEWRVSSLARKGVWTEAVLPAATSQMLAAAGPPKSSLRLIHDPEPTLGERLQACNGKGFFATANCRAQVCTTYGADAPECRIEPLQTLP